MRRLFIPIAAGATLLLLAVSCQIAEIDSVISGSVSGTELTFTACIENDGIIAVEGEEYAPETKTMRLSDGKVWWTPGDAISLFYGGDDIVGGNKFIAETTEPAAVTTFKGNISAATGGGEDVNPDDVSFWAAYPYDENTVCDGKSVTISLPSAQVSGEDTFSQGQWPTVGKSSGLLLSFKNIAAGYKFKVESEGITKIVIRTTGTGHPLAGTLNISMDKDGIPVVNSVTNPSDEVVITPEDGGTFKNDGTYYYATVLYQYLDAGVYFDFYTDDSVATYECVLTGSKPERPSGRGKFKVMDNKDHGLTWSTRMDVAFLPSGPDFYNAIRENIDVYCSPSGQLDIAYIGFEPNSDPGKGTIISSKGAPIEIQYDSDWRFLDVLTSADKFVADENCAQLLADLDIELIFGLTDIDFSKTKNFTSFFRNDVNLIDVRFALPAMDMSSAEWIEGMFEGCSKLQELDFNGKDLSKVTSLNGVFSGCETLKTIDLSGAKFGEIPYFEYTFYNCRSLESVDMSSVSTPYPYTSGMTCEGMFADCSKLSNVYFGEGFRIGQSSNDTYDSMFGLGVSDTGKDDPDNDGIYTIFHCTPGQAAVLKGCVDSNHSDAYEYLTVIPGDFSVSATKKVRFSGGNLTYTVDSDRWGFFENQYDYATEYDANLISLFTWGCGLWSKIPDTELYSEAANYGVQLSYIEDWGSRLVPYGKWRTLSSEEWVYLLNERTMAGGSPRYYVGDVTIESSIYSGLFLYPDNYDGDNISAGSMTWAQICDAGIVFLPCTNYRRQRTTELEGQDGGRYWTIDSPGYVGSANLLYIYLKDLSVDTSWSIQTAYGLSVRLVAEVN